MSDTLQLVTNRVYIIPYLGLEVVDFNQRVESRYCHNILPTFDMVVNYGLNIIPHHIVTNLLGCFTFNYPSVIGNNRVVLITEADLTKVCFVYAIKNNSFETKPSLYIPEGTFIATLDRYEQK